jgi:uncharacterized phage protein (predicted DNA packaging)
MLRFLTLEQIREHTRIDTKADDSILELYGKAAEDTIIAMTNRTLEEIFDKYGEIPGAIEHAALLLTAHSYNNREPASVQQLYAVPYTLDALIKPYIKLA